MHCVGPAKSVQMNGLKPVLVPSSVASAAASNGRNHTNRDCRKVAGGRQNTLAS